MRDGSSNAKASSTKGKTPTGGNRSTGKGKQSGKKTTSSSASSNSGTPELEITQENMAIYKAIQAKLKAEKKAAAASHDEGKLF